MPIELVGIANPEYTTVEVEYLKWVGKTMEELRQQNADLLAALKKAKYLMDENPKDGHKVAYAVITMAFAKAEGGE